MKKTIFPLLVILSFYGSVQGQESSNDTVLIYAFSDAFALVASDDESELALIIDNRYLEFYHTDSLEFHKRFKVSRNAWLEKAFFYSGNKEFYYDYGTQLKYKYKRIDLVTGDFSKVKCVDVPRGCGYKSIKYCSSISQKLVLKKKKLLFVHKGIDIEVYKIYQNCTQH